MGLANFFKSQKEDKFIGLLIQQAEVTVEGIKLLQECIQQPDEESIEKMRAKEYEADEIRRILIDELHDTFITPIDREDIFNLSLNIDDMLDYALTTIEEMNLLKIDADEYLTEMVSLVRQEAEELAMAMHRLSENPRVAGQHAQRAKKLENEVEHLYRTAIADLFTKAKDFKPLMIMLRRREVYRHVANMSDKADAAANVFGMVVMKLT
jgi:predicted phosphate transport protein (TIGR00153 family)